MRAYPLVHEPLEKFTAYAGMTLHRHLQNVQQGMLVTEITRSHALQAPSIFGNFPLGSGTKGWLY